MAEQPADKVTPLRECPFCGKESSGQEFGPGAYIAKASQAEYYTVICSACCSTATCTSRKRAIEKWNTRVPSAAVEALVESVSVLLSNWPANRDGMDYKELPAGLQSTRVALDQVAELRGHSIPSGCPTCYWGAINVGLAAAGKFCDLHAAKNVERKKENL